MSSQLRRDMWGNPPFLKIYCLFRMLHIGISSMNTPCYVIVYKEHSRPLPMTPLSLVVRTGDGLFWPM